MEGFIQDLRYGLRMVWSAKGFSAVVVLTLGLAIGANSTLFTLVSHTLLGPIPFRDTDELVFVSFRNSPFTGFALRAPFRTTSICGPVSRASRTWPPSPPTSEH